MISTKKIASGEHKVYWNNEPTDYHIYNADMGVSGRQPNMYGIHNQKTGKHQVVGSLQKAKKMLHFTMSKQMHESEGMVGGAPVNNVGSGDIAGLGVGPQGEPGINKKNKKKIIPFKMFTRNPPNLA